MLLADPLSRLCSPSSGFFDPTLPAKLQALLRYLPEDMKHHDNVRVYAFKDTAALSRHIQQWRMPKNPISQGRLSSATAKNSFHIGILNSDGNFRELLDLLEKGIILSAPVNPFPPSIPPAQALTTTSASAHASLSFAPPLIADSGCTGVLLVSPTFLLSSLSSLPSPYPSSPSLSLTVPSCKWAAPHISLVSSAYPTRPLRFFAISCLTSLSRILVLVCLLSFGLTA